VELAYRYDAEESRGFTTVDTSKPVKRGGFG
jgi:hypothetical protein